MKYWETAALDETASVHLDAVRSLAAFDVVIGHARNLFLQPYESIAFPSYLDKVIYFVTGLGHQAVIAFFVLSGFFIGASVIKSFQTQTWSWRIYLVNRLTRLWIVLLPALLLCALWDKIGMHIRAAAALYNSPLYALSPVGLANHETLPNFLGNLFFLQGVLVPPFGSNTPLWSLSYEFWYYLLFPMMLFAFMSKNQLVLRCLSLSLSILAMCFIGRIISLYYFIWLAGVVVFLSLGWRLVRSVKSRYLGFALTVPPLFTALILVRLHRIQSEQAGDFLVAATFVFWMFFLLQPGARKPSSLYSKTARETSSFSYTLYLTHFPFLLLLKAWIIPQSAWFPNFTAYLYLMLLTMTAVLFAGVVGFFTERNTSSIRSHVLLWTKRSNELFR